MALLLISGSASPAQAAPKGPEIDAIYRHWAVAAEPWMAGGGLGETEKTAFAALGSDQEKELFMRAFWRARGRLPELNPGQAASQDPGRQLEAWWHRFTESRRRFGGFEGDRARALLAIGIPDRVHVYGGCRGVLRPARIWHYDRYQASALFGEPRETGFYLVFTRDYSAADGLFQSWRPAEGLGGLVENNAPHTRRSVDQILTYSRERRCFRTGEEEAAVLRAALTTALDPAELVSTLTQLPADPGWLEAFATDLREGRATLPIETVAVGYPGHDAAKALVLGRIEAATERIGRGAAGQLFDRWVLTGEVRLGRHTVDRFEVVYHLAGAAPGGDTVSLDFYRRLRPTGSAPYTLRLRLEDARGLALLREDVRIDVPKEGPRLEVRSRPEGVRQSLSELTRREVVRLLTFPGIELLHPGESLVGRVEVEAVTTGRAIAEVAFELDGKRVATDRQAPYRATVDLGPEPADHEIEALAFDAAGRQLDRDRLHLDPAQRPLSVSLELGPNPAPNTPGANAGGPNASAPGSLTGGGSLAEATVALPRGKTLQSLRLLLDGTLVGEWAAPSFRKVLSDALLASGKVLRAVARLESGETAEDLIILGPGRLDESIDVRLIEVFATVLDGAGRPVTGLGSGDFQLFENDQPQDLVRFDAVANLPIQVALLMDTSVSMRGRLELASTSARRFFGTVLTEKDSAALVVFHHDIRLAVPFTADLDRLHLGASGLDAWGGTRLADSLVYATNYFAGREGRRALVVLSDGRDVGSSFDFAEVEELVTRAGLAVYPILLAVEDAGTRAGLEGLASASGGRAFSIRTVEQLDGVYSQIQEELRSQYLLVFQTTAGDRSFRRLQVKCLRPGLRCRSIRGYYPP